MKWLTAGREAEAEDSAFCRISYERRVTWQSLWTCWYSKSNGSKNSSAINRQAVRTAALKIDFLKFFWFMFLSFFITSIKSWIRKSKGKSRKIVLFLKNCELSKILQLCLKWIFSQKLKTSNICTPYGLGGTSASPPQTI